MSLNFMNKVKNVEEDIDLDANELKRELVTCQTMAEMRKAAVALIEHYSTVRKNFVHKQKQLEDNEIERQRLTKALSDERAINEQWNNSIIALNAKIEQLSNLPTITVLAAESDGVVSNDFAEAQPNREADIDIDGDTVVVAGPSQVKNYDKLE